MTTKARRLAAAVVAAATGASLGQTVHLDFEGLDGMDFRAGRTIPVESRLSDAFAGQGVVFSSSLGYVAVVELGTTHAPSGINGIGGSRAPDILTYAPAHPIVARFVGPADPTEPALARWASLRIDLTGGSGLDVTLNAYDTDGVLIDSMTKPDVGGADLRVEGQLKAEVVHRRARAVACAEKLDPRDPRNPAACPPCHADLTGDRALDTNDFFAFLAAYQAGCP